MRWEAPLEERGRRPKMTQRVLERVSGLDLMEKKEGEAYQLEEEMSSLIER